MKKYELNRVGSEIKETGYAQEGYESILPFNTWLALSKIKLNKDVVVKKTYKLPRLYLKQTEKFFDFIDEIKADKGFDKITFEYENGEYNLCFKKEYSRRLTDEELLTTYFRNATTIMKKNNTTYSKFLEKEKARLVKEETEKRKRDADYKVYLELKKRFEDEKV